MMGLIERLARRAKGRPSENAISPPPDSRHRLRVLRNPFGTTNAQQSHISDASPVAEVRGATEELVIPSSSSSSSDQTGREPAARAAPPPRKESEAEITYPPQENGPSPSVPPTKPTATPIVFESAADPVSATDTASRSILELPPMAIKEPVPAQPARAKATLSSSLRPLETQPADELTGLPSQGLGEPILAHSTVLKPPYENIDRLEEEPQITGRVPKLAADDGQRLPPARLEPVQAIHPPRVQPPRRQEGLVIENLIVEVVPPPREAGRRRRATRRWPTSARRQPIRSSSKLRF